ncbi:hypothetical protein [Cohnella boryungensis]|uniref:HNH endonuclease n=1 Tax=Cohnella boryungensis TaxID=768479 RepID=A0ABV8SA60_9BACL
MYRYAQIDDTGVCVSVSQLSGEVDATHMLPLGSDDDVQPGDFYDGHSWVRPDPPVLKPDRIAQLETENLELKLALAELAEAQQTYNSRWPNWLKF